MTGAASAGQIVSGAVPPLILTFFKLRPAKNATYWLSGDQNGAHLIALSAATGNLIWITPLDPHPDAIITHKYVPILILGGIGGLIIGGLIHGWRANI